MRKHRSYKISAFHESLEPRLCLSAINCLVTPGPVILSSPVSGIVVDDPPPDPEPDPGDLPTDQPPILVPPIPPSGPVGPALYLQPVLVIVPPIPPSGPVDPGIQPTAY
jgi:hypothetical protein